MNRLSYACSMLSLMLYGGNSIVENEFLMDFEGLVRSNDLEEVKYHHERKLYQLYNYYWEIPETCPPKTSCPLICVYDESYCPTKCPKGYNLCVDGSCSIEECSPHLWNLCQCDALYFACPRVIDYLDACYVRFEQEYDNNTLCLEEQAYSTPKVSFVSFWFVFCYCWISIVTFLVIGYCYYNQKMNPIQKTSEKTLYPISSIDGSDTVLYQQQEWKQIGYKTNLVGLIIGFLVYFTLWAIQFLLFFLTICYYMQQESITRWPPPFQDDVQVLLAFIIVWSVGFVFSFSFHWPHSITSLFLRRCILREATHVAVVAPIMQVQSIASGRMKWGDILVRTIWAPIDRAYHIIFSYPLTPNDYETTYCPVDNKTRSFYHRMGRYVFNDIEEKYVPASMKIGNTIEELSKWKEGLTSKQVNLHQAHVGPNVISIPKPNWFHTVYIEFSKPFYLYQTFILWTWFNYWYFQMALVGTITRFIGGLTVASFQYDNDRQLYKLSCVHGNCEVIRDDTKTNIDVYDLVPGDIVVLKPGLVFCDMIILESDHLVVDESALTGESNPIAKSSMAELSPDHIYHEVKDKQYSIYAGTTILEVGDNDNERGLVVLTGSSTRKGKLLTDVLSYRRIKFQFDDEVNLVILLLFFEGIILITLVCCFLQDEPVFAWFYSAFVLATIYPPLLVTVFVVSVGVSAKRLSKRNITCTNSEVLLVAGKVNCCCFDKTGTLTETTMTSVDIDILGNEELNSFASLGMAVCHNLRMLESGELIGNEVDKAIFKSSQAVMLHDKRGDIEVLHSDERYIAIKQFLFDHHRTTQSVIVEANDGKTFAFVKGSSESVRGLCLPDSVPSSFTDAVQSYSKAGKYVIALAYKVVTLETHDYSLISRDDIEQAHSFSFCGLITMENPLKNETRLVMDNLRKGNMLMTMITGDAVHNGIKVAKEAGISDAETFLLCQVSTTSGIEWVHAESDIVVDQPKAMYENIGLAITGEAWRILLEEDLGYALSIAKYIRVFGRCNPVDKVSIVTALVKIGCVTLMCGDGQNDCGALKSAHVGISLSTADASIVAPFTSLDLTLNAVVEVLLEGRCALSSAFKVYTFFMIYGQVCSILQTTNAYFFASFGDWAWIFIDGIWPLCLSFTLPLAKAAKSLSPRRPTASLFGIRTTSSLCGMLFICTLFIVIGMKMLFRQDWFQCRKWDNKSLATDFDLGDNYETEVLLIVGGFQFIAPAIALNFGYSWRAAWYTNYWFLFFAALFTVFHFVMTLYPSPFSCIWRVNCSAQDVVLGFGTVILYPINNLYNTTVMPPNFRWKLAGLIFTNLVALCAWEYFFVNGILNRWCSFGKDEPLIYSTETRYEDKKSVCNENQVKHSSNNEGEKERRILLESTSGTSSN